MLGVCIRYSRNKEEAEDVLMEGFMTVYTKIKDYRSTGSFEGWIRRIMINTAINHYRSNLKHAYHYDLDDFSDEISSAPPADTRYDKEKLLKLIQDLPDGYRMVFNLYAMEGYSHKEIAEMLNISVNTSKSQLSKARKFLQKGLKKLY